MKVIKGFYCIKTGKKYSVGDDYKGTRKDINHLLATKRPSRASSKKEATSKKNWAIAEKQKEDDLS